MAWSGLPAGASAASASTASACIKEAWMTGLPLANHTVLDLSEGVAGPFCAKLLADYGAHVLKVERPAVGDATRNWGPFPSDRPHRERSGSFLHLNTSKRGYAELLALEPENIERLRERCVLGEVPLNRLV